MQDVPTLEANTLDFIFVRQLRIDTSVDQQAELESVLVIFFFIDTSVDQQVELESVLVILCFCFCVFQYHS